MRVSIIIRAYNEARFIAKLLMGIKKQEFTFVTSVEVILVDSGSTDSTVFIAENAGAKIIHIEKESFSFGRALNIGCEAATGDFLIFASAHVYPLYTNWIEKLIKPFLKNDKIALVYGSQTGNDLTKFSEQKIFEKWFPPQSNYDQESPFCNNANCAIRRSLWLTQEYDESLTGLEDLDWANKIISKGYKIVYESTAKVVHVHIENFEQIKNRYFREALALKQIIPEVHFDIKDFIKHFIFNTFIDFYFAFKKSVLINEFSNIILFRYKQFHGTYLGHKKRGTISRDLKNKFYYSSGINTRKSKEINETFDISSVDKIEYI